METKNELDEYVVRWYEQLMSHKERLAQRHLFATMKATQGASDVVAQDTARNSRVHSRQMSDDPEVLGLTSEGYEKFIARTAARILTDHGDEVVFNRCPKCGGLARTPSAKQCRFCACDWHDTK